MIRPVRETARRLIGWWGRAPVDPDALRLDQIRQQLPQRIEAAKQQAATDDFWVRHSPRKSAKAFSIAGKITERPKC